MSTAIPAATDAAAALAALTPAADKFAYFTSATVAALGDAPAFGRSILAAANAAAVPALNQNTTGSAATLTTPRAIYGNNFDGSAALAQIIGSAFGGTGNGFTKFSGPTTAEKTFTLPDASAAILTSNAAVTVAQGGTGAATLGAGGVLVGDGTNAVHVTAVGTSGHVLTSQGVGLNPTFQALPAAGANTALSNLAAVAINTSLLLATTDTGALGDATHHWSDLFLAEGGVINWDGGDVTLTQTGNVLSVSGGVFTNNAAVAYGRDGQNLETNTSADNGGVALNTWWASNQGVHLDLNRSRSDNIGTHTILQDDDIVGAVMFRASDGVGFIAAAAIRVDIDGTPGANDMPGRLTLCTTAAGASSVTDRLSVDNGGVVNIGGTEGVSTVRSGQLLEVHIAGQGGAMALNAWVNSAASTVIDLNHSRSAIVGTHTILSSGDTVGAIIFRGSDGTGFINAASITGAIDGTPSTNDMPGRLTFSTTADGASSPTTRETIDSTGQIGIGVTPVAATGMLQILAADNGICVNLKINANQAGITGADTFTSFASTDGVEAAVVGTGVAGVIAYSTFTGSHWSQCDSIEKHQKEVLSHRPCIRTYDDGTQEEYDDEKLVKVYESSLEPGTVLISTNEMCAWNGRSSEILPKCAVSTGKEDKSVYGVFGGHDRDGDIHVLALGSGPVLVCDEGGPIEIGDFLCTSSTAGYAMHYKGNDMRAVLAKARQPHESGLGKIACTYMAG